MAKAAPPAYPYDESKTFHFEVSRTVRVGAFAYLPRDKPRGTGVLLNRIVKEHGEDAIRTAKPV